MRIGYAVSVIIAATWLKGKHNLGKCNKQFCDGERGWMRDLGDPSRRSRGNLVNCFPSDLVRLISSGNEACRNQELLSLRGHALVVTSGVAESTNKVLV